MNPDLTTTDVIASLEGNGHSLREWGKARDGTPMLSARVGGDRRPAVFITAGAHCTETAGVHASLDLIDSLDTEREVHILPLRDPLGFAGVSHCLSFASGLSVAFPDPEASLDYLRKRAQLLWGEGDIYLFQLGELGFVWAPPQPGLDTFWRAFALTSRLPRDEPEVLEPLRGKTVLLLNVNSDIEGSGAMQRCYHTVLGRQNEWLHLNRFFGRDDAPPEVAAVDRLIQTVRPGLTIDLHEGNGEGFWLPIPRREDGEELVFEMSRAFLDYIHQQGYPVTDFEQWRATNGIDTPDPDWMLPEPRLPGLFWLQQELKDEGPNLMTYASRIGIGYGTEGPMIRPLAMRTDGLANGTKAAIRVWESNT